MRRDDRPVSPVVAGWQNVGREIMRRIQTYRCHEGESLIERETAELDAWRLAHGVVLDRLETMMEEEQ